jgi:hypothetical protein
VDERFGCREFCDHYVFSSFLQAACEFRDNTTSKQNIIEQDLNSQFNEIKILGISINLNFHNFSPNDYYESCSKYRHLSHTPGWIICPETGSK